LRFGPSRLSFSVLLRRHREGVETPVVIAVLLIGLGVFAFFAVLLRLV
jgi:hypothetical protein